MEMLPEEHLTFLKRLSTEEYLIFDPDNMRVAPYDHLIKKQYVSTGYMDLPSGRKFTIKITGEGSTYLSTYKVDTTRYKQALIISYIALGVSIIAALIALIK